jgi:hypothetical protein
MASRTNSAKNQAFTLPAKAKLQSIRSGVGVVIPSELIKYYGIVDPAFYDVNFYIAQGGFFLELERRERN